MKKLIKFSPCIHQKTPQSDQNCDDDVQIIRKIQDSSEGKFHASFVEDSGMNRTIDIVQTWSNVNAPHPQ
jgi:hypothetical protein